MTRLLGAFRKELPATLIAACFVAACGASPVPGGDVGPDGGIRLTQHDGAGSDGGAIPDLVAELPEGTPDLVGCEPDCEGKACGDDGCGGWCGECPLGSFCIDGFCLTASQCEPDCAGLLCGGDGCGGLCGLCLGGEFCDLGICSSGSCEPDCDQMECGDDGCGGLCGTCPPGHNCLEGSCLCQVSCEGKACGDNGCGGSCGQCGPGLTCVGGQCLCEPDCTGKACGDNGCGGGCGSCLLGESCVGGTCKAGSCVPDCAGKSCGTDGCDGSCGSCLPNHVCTAGVCECLPSCGGKDCGDDGCGGDCGSCPPASICIANQCVCWPSCDGVDCGPDGCGGSCGSCPENAVCDGGKCADMLGKALDCGDGNCFDNCGPFDDPTLPGGRTSYVVALAKLSPDGSSWARLARYAFDPDGTVVETVWFWNYDSDTGKQEVDKSKSSCDKAACKVYAPARFPSGGGYPKTIKGVWSLTDKQLTVTWAIGATEMWTLNDRCDMVRLDLVDSNYGITHGVAYGSLSDAGLGLSVEDRMEGPDVLLQGPWARLKGDDYAEGVSSENFPGAWKACDKALAVKKYSTTSCNECDKGKTTKVRNYLAWKGGRMDAWELFCECLIPNAKCYNKKPRLRAFLQVLDDAGRFRGWVGIEASLYADAVDRMAWKVLVDDGACQPSCEGVPVGTPDGCGGLCGIGPPPPNNDPKRILVYTANVENLPKPDYAPESCAGDWQDLLHYMRTQAHAPDFLLVQQISDNGQLDYLAGQMEAMLGGDYGTIIAVKEPAYWD